MLSIESGEERSISSERRLLKLCSMILRGFVGHHESVPAPVVDGVSGPENIANLWCSHLKQLYNTVDGSASTDLLSALDSGISHDELDRASISAEVIEVAIGKLKRGKSDGDTLMSNHIIEALYSICQFLACLFISVLRHGFMPLSFRDATIQPTPKRSKDPSLSANYCRIAFAFSLSKVMEWSILLTWESFFTTSNLQFGFKSGFSTTLCTGVLKAVINCYLNNGSKAFDLVDHHILFDKLLERGTPKPVVCLLLLWYKSQQLCIHWMGRSSEYFEATNGVRQGGVLSPILFTIYLDSLLECFQASSRGCYWDKHFSLVPSVMLIISQSWPLLLMLSEE